MKIVLDDARGLSTRLKFRRKRFLRKIEEAVRYSHKNIRGTGRINKQVDDAHKKYQHLLD